jgi:hypothetical protein
MFDGLFGARDMRLRDRKFDDYFDPSARKLTGSHAES